MMSKGNKKRGLFSRVLSRSGFLPFGLCFAGRGSPSRAQQVRLGDVAKIKVKAEAIGKQPVHVRSIIAWPREGVKCKRRSGKGAKKQRRKGRKART
jgi:hypothetical protein